MSPFFQQNQRIYGSPAGLFGAATGCLLIIANWICIPAQAVAQPNPSSSIPNIEFNLLELPSSQLAQAALQTESRFFWEKTPLRDGLKELSQVHGITIWIDRRIDPTQPITIATVAGDQSSTLLSRCRQIAALVGQDVGLIENVIYFGPPGVPKRLQLAAIELHDELSRAAVAGSLGKTSSATLRDFAWAELSSPLTLQQQLEQTWNIKLEANSQHELPHDLFHSGEFLQPSSLATQFTVVLGGFDLQARLSRTGNLGSGNLGIAGLRSGDRWQTNYAKDAVELRRLTELKQAFPSSLAQTRGNVTQVLGPTDFHLGLLAPAQRPPPLGKTPRRSGAQIENTFKVANIPLEAVINKLAGSLGIEFVWDAAITDEQRRRLVSLEVNQASTAQLLQEVARASGFKLTSQGTQVTISPAN